MFTLHHLKAYLTIHSLWICSILPDFEEYLARKNWMLLRIERVKREILDARIHQLGSAKHQAEITF